MGEGQRGERLVFVDFLRGTSALLVAFFHVWIHQVLLFPDRPIEKGSWSEWLHGHFILGVFGVAVFFIVSGFLIPHGLRAPGGSIQKFAIHRAFRLFPAYWLSIAGALVIAGMKGLTPPGAQLLSNLFMVQGLFGQQDLNGVFWTLKIELVFYLLCALFFTCRWLNRTELLVYVWVIASIMCAAARMILEEKLPVALFLGLTLMFLGDLMRRYMQGGVSRRAVLRASSAVVVALVPACWMAYGELRFGYLSSYLAAVSVFGVCFWIRTRFEQPGAHKWISMKLGDTSYALYLFHPLLSMPLAAYLLARGVSVAASVITALVVGVLFSALVYAWIEKPFIAMGRRLAKHYFVAKTAIPAARIS